MIKGHVHRMAYGLDRVGKHPFIGVIHRELPYRESEFSMQSEIKDYDRERCIQIANGLKTGFVGHCTPRPCGVLLAEGIAVKHPRHPGSQTPWFVLWMYVIRRYN